MPNGVLPRIAPILFVLIGSTSWIVVKFITPFADPLTFLALRFQFAALFAVLIAYAAGAPQPASLGQLGNMLLSGVLMQAITVGGAWWAIAHGLPASLAVIIAVLQPLLSAAFGELFLGEKTSPRQWAGVALGFIGVFIVLSPRLTMLSSQAFEIDALPLLLAFASMIAMTLGTFHQKHFIRHADLRTLVAYQYIGAFIFTFPIAWALEPMYFELGTETTLALAWSVLGISIAAMWLYLYMLRHGSVARVTSLLYLFPPLVALQAYFFFDETLTLVQIAGVALTVCGVYLATHKSGAVSRQEG